MRGDSKLELARAYVEPQEYTGNRWAPMEALMKGTVFPELYRSYDVRPETKTIWKFPNKRGAKRG